MANRGGAAQGWHREDTHALASRRKSSAALERRIAAAIGVSPHTLWPDRWTPEGLRRPQSVIRSKASRLAAEPHRQKRKAA